MGRILTLVTACVLLLAACGDDADEASPEREAQPQGEAAEATIEATSSGLGDILVDPEGMTLYMFEPDEQEGEPTCYDDCAATWPPFEAAEDPVAGDGVDQSLLGTVERTDGAAQVTYNDLTLYYFSGDEEAGDTNGQGLNDVWWVVSPEGDPVME